MEIIDELEPARRGLYGGALGYLDLRGNLDFCIAIRTIVLAAGRATVQAGAGIVADSDPPTEQRETEAKAGALFAALGLAGELEA
jgi:anthranilate synthase component 1